MITDLMRVLKLMLACGLVLSVVSLFSNVNAESGHLRMLWPLTNAAIFGGAFYGIQTRTRVVWILGFLGIAVCAVSVLIQGLRLLRSVSTTATNVQIESVFLVVATVLVTAYWSRWWARQKSYFIKPS
jgi:hypothetical protein